MKKTVALLVMLLVALGQAQDPLKALVLPFDANQSFEPYGLGFATGLQRSLNSIEGVYVPAVAEAGLFVTRAHEAGLEAVDAAAEVFAADVVISGSVTASGRQLAVTLVFGGPRFPDTEQVNLTVPSDPVSAIEGVAIATASRLGLSAPGTEERLKSLASETPEVTSLQTVSRATSRLGASLGELAAAADLNPGSSWVLAELARAQALAGRVEEALMTATNAVEANPEDAEAWVALGIVANAAGDSERANDSLNEALALNANHALALVGLAEVTEGDEGDAELLARALSASPRQIEAVLELAQMESTPQRALQVLRRWSVNLPESVALHRAFVNTAVAAGDPAGALAYLRDVLSDPLAASPALYAQAAALPDSQAESALALVREGRERYPDSSGLELTEVELLQRAGRPDEALALLESLHQRFPESVDVANRLAVALASAGQIERATEVFRSAADDSPTVRLNLGRLLLEAGQARAAIATLEPLLAANPNDSELLTLHGVALGRVGRIDEALETLNRALEIDPTQDTASRAHSLLEQRRQIVGGEEIAFEGEAADAFEQGLLALETGDDQAAATSFARAFDLSGHALAAFYQGYALHRSGSIRDSLEPYQIAAESYPDSDTVLNNLGYAQLQLGRFDLALTTLQHAAEANGENSRVQVNLGLTFFGLGRFDDALAAWDRAIALEPALEDDLANIRGRAREGRGSR
jgi:tetratricopeptide (TPR) repeat protein